VPVGPESSELATRDLFGGQVVLVTGSSSGIGAAVATMLAHRGATVVVSSARSIEAGTVLAERLPGADYVPCDIADAEQVDRAIATVIDRHGRLDALVNNAGTTKVVPHADLSGAPADLWRQIFEVNVVGTWQMTVAAVPHLRASGRGQVVNVSSIAGERPTGSSIPYACSKAAVSHMTRLLAAALGPDVRVNAVAPGFVDTPWTATWDTVRATVEAGAPLRRTGTPDDVAAAICGLMSSPYVTGAVLLVDGGLHLT